MNAEPLYALRECQSDQYLTIAWTCDGKEIYFLHNCASAASRFHLPAAEGRAAEINEAYETGEAIGDEHPEFEDWRYQSYIEKHLSGARFVAVGEYMGQQLGQVEIEPLPPSTQPALLAIA